MNPHWTRKELESASRAGARHYQQSSRVVVCRVLDKFKMFVDPTDEGIAPHLIMDGFWESWNTVAMAKLVQPGMRIVNVGANFGYFTMLFSELVGSGGRVIAVEPQCDVHRALQKSIEINGFRWTDTFNGAAGAANGHAHVEYEDVRFKNASMKFVPLGEALRDGVADVVNCLTLDAICARHWGTEDLPDIVFVDAEGTEPEVFAGMKRTKTKPGMKLVLEFSPKRYANPLEFAQLLQSEFYLSEISEHSQDGALVSTSPEELVRVPEFTMVVAHKK